MKSRSQKSRNQDSRSHDSRSPDSRSQVLSRLTSSATALRAAVTAIIALHAAAGANAATKTWDGGAGTSSWHTAANWDNDTLPVAGDDIVISVPGPVTVEHAPPASIDDGPRLPVVALGAWGVCLN